MDDKKTDNNSGADSLVFNGAEESITSKKSRVWLAIVIILVIVSLVAGGLLLRDKQSSNLDDSKQAATQDRQVEEKLELVFPSISREVSDGELLQTALQRVMDIDNLSYDLDIQYLGKYQGKATYDFSGSQLKFYLKAVDTDPGPAAGEGTTELYLDAQSNNAYFKLTNPNIEGYNDKWVLINETTAIDAPTGSEIIFIRIFAPVGWEVPILFGDLDGQQAVIADMSDPKYFTITSSVDENYNGTIPAKKLKVTIDKKELNAAYRSYNQGQGLNATAPGSVFYNNELDNEPSEFTLWIATDNAQILAADRMLTEQETNFIGAAGDYFRYKNFRYNSNSIVAEPTDVVPFNELNSAD